MMGRTPRIFPIILVVIDGGLTPVKIFFRLRLQNLFSGVCPPSVADGRWLAVVLCCVCLRVMAMVSMSARCSKGNDYGFNVSSCSKWCCNIGRC